MKRKETGEVVLTDKELEATALRDLLNEQGDGPITAAEEALRTFKGEPSKTFVEWLSGGRLTKDSDKNIVAVPEDDAEADDASVESDSETQPEPAATGS
jgi:hypothetical protein